MAFYNRIRELRFLESQAAPNRAALVVLYGRRRTGKTALLRHFAQGRRSITFVADQSSRADQLASFSTAVFEALHEPGLVGTSFPSWEAALRFVASRALTEPLFLVLDELSYLCDADPALPSVLQRLWDAGLKDSRLHIVLCGSFISFMERELLGARNPLYGRRSGDWLLEPLAFRDSRLFLAALPLDSQAIVYGLLGGIPAYLERWDPARSLDDNIIDLILRRGAPLRDEPRFLMMEELRDPRIYFSLCRAIAMGATTPNEIAQSAGVADRGVASRYIETLRDLRLVERRVPATERNPERTRRGHYRLSDPLFRFWFRFVLPNMSALEAGDPGTVFANKVAPHLEQQVSVAFEAMAEQHVWQLIAEGALPAYDRIGGWWKAGEEVDVIGVADADRRLLVGECKWSRRPVGVDVLEALQLKAQLVARELDGAPREVVLALWSRSGFTPELSRRAGADIRLFGLEEMAGAVPAQGSD